MKDDLEYELDRTAVTPEFLGGISRDIPIILSRSLGRSTLKLHEPSTPLGAEASEEVYIILRRTVNQGRQERNEPPLTDIELVARLEEDRDFYVRKLGVALLYYQLKT